MTVMHAAPTRANEGSTTKHRDARRRRFAAAAAGVLLAALAWPVVADAVPPQQPGAVDLLAEANVRIDGAAAGDETASAVAPAGDVNGDGLGDVILGAHLADNNGRMNSGSAYVIFGRAGEAGVDLAALGSGGFRIDGAVASDIVGEAVAGAGDINADGRADVVVATRDADYNGRQNSGSAYVVFGKAGSASVDLAALGGAGFRIDGAAANDGLGNAVGGAGDVNGDGRPDVVLGAPGATANGRTSSGAAYVVFGKAGNASIDLAALGAGGFEIGGAAPSDIAGNAVAGAGDVNADGRTDVIVAAQGSDAAGSEAGSAYVVFGKAGSASVDLAALGAAGFAMHGAAAGDLAGNAVAGAGDVNGDGRADVIVGARFAIPLAEGRAYVVFGKASGASVNLGALGSGGFRIDGEAGTSDQAGTSVAGAGDVNGDGRPDVLVGAVFADHHGRTSAGSAYVVFGKASTATIELGSLGTGGFVIDGAVAGDNAGQTVAGAGDFDGDGHADVLVAAPRADPAARASAGSAYVFDGFAAPSLSYAAVVGQVGTPIAAVAPVLSRTGAAKFAVAPALPAGLALDPVTGVVSGTPTVVTPATAVTVTMTDLGGSVDAALPVTVTAKPAAPPPPAAPPAPRPACSDGVDNDRDGLIDHADGGCVLGGVYRPEKNSEASIAPIAQCAKGQLQVTDVVARGSRTRVAGVAGPDAVGRQVAIFTSWNGKQAAIATVQGDLTFTTTAPLPPARIRNTNTARYQVRLASVRSPYLKFLRRMTDTSVRRLTATRVRIGGRVTKPLGRVATVTVRAANRCQTQTGFGGTVVARGIRVTRAGRWTATITLPRSLRGSQIFLRAQTRVPKTPTSRATSTTYTLIQGIALT